MDDVEKRIAALLAECPDVVTYVTNLTQLFYHFQLCRKTSERQQLLKGMRAICVDLIRAVDEQLLKMSTPDQLWDHANLGKRDG